MQSVFLVWGEARVMGDDRESLETERWVAKVFADKADAEGWIAAIPTIARLKMGETGYDEGQFARAMAAIDPSFDLQAEEAVRGDLDFDLDDDDDEAQAIEDAPITLMDRLPEYRVSERAIERLT